MTAQDLKNAILQLAVQGKLVPQDPNDEPASELLKRICAEKEQLIKAGVIKKEKPFPPITDEEMPFEIPESWEWVHLNQIATCSLGKTMDKARNSGTACPYLCSINVYWEGISLSTIKTALFTEEEKRKYSLLYGDLLICEGGEVGRTAVWESNSEMYYQNALHRVRFFDKINPHYFRFLMEYLKGVGIIDQYSKGQTIKHLVQGALNSILMPLPPLAEQQRIVAKIEELMPLLEEYGKAEERLTALNAEFPDKLRKSILQQAIQGKLTERDPADEPASELLKRIRAEKERLIKEGKIKKEKPLPPITEEEMPFEIPETWAWSSINELFFVTKLAGFEYTKYFSKDNIRANYPVHIVRAKHVKMGKFIENEDEAIADELSVLLNRSALTQDCLLMTFIGAGIGDTCLYHSEKRHHLAPNVAKIEPQTSGILLPYYLIWLMSPEGQKSVEQIKKSTAQPSLSMETIRSIRVAVPPLAEQQRIVDRVNELLAACDELK